VSIVFDAESLTNCKLESLPELLKLVGLVIWNVFDGIFVNYM
jgi:hypothetical protein